jgi:hypothetical protein
MFATKCGSDALKNGTLAGQVPLTHFAMRSRGTSSRHADDFHGRQQRSLHCDPGSSFSASPDSVQHQ